jgi:hypothetical protein
MQGTKDRNWVQMKKCGYLKAIYFNPCDGPQDYPNCAVQMLIRNKWHITENYEVLFCLPCAT